MNGTTSTANGNGNGNGKRNGHTLLDDTTKAPSSPDSNGKTSNGKSSSGHSGTNGNPLNGARANLPRSNERHEQVLRDLKIEIGQAVMAEKLPPGILLRNESPIELVTNIYGIEQNTDEMIHSCHFEISKILPHREIKFSAFPRRVNDHLAILRRKLYKQIMPKFYETYQDLFGEDFDAYIHDFASTFFSFKQLFAESNAPRKHEFVLDPDQLGEGFRDISYKLVIDKPSGEYDPANFRQVYSDMDTFDASVIRFAELATSHNVAQNTDDFFMFNNKSFYYANPTKHGYSESDSPPLGYGKYIALGAEKSVIFIEGSTSGGVPALVVDAKKSPFYLTINCCDFVVDFLKLPPNALLTDAQLKRIRPFFRNLAVHRNYGNTSSVILINGLVNQNALQVVINETGQTIADYFADKYTIHLKNPLLPLAEVRYRDGSFNYFPIEVLEIADHQRVKTGMQTPYDVRKIIKVAAVLPLNKMEDIRTAVGALNINNDSFCQKAGTTITEEPLTVTGRVLAPPERIFDEKPISSSVQFDSVLINRFKSCETVRAWAAVLINFENVTPELKLKTFVGMFNKECMNRGIKLPEVAEMLVVKANMEDIEKLFFDCRRAGVQFILFCHPDGDVEFHDPIKAFERKYIVITQCVKTSTMDAIVDHGKPLALQNIVAKTNCKLGGYNYQLVLNNAPLDSFALYIGIALNHPGGQESSFYEKPVGVAGVKSKPDSACSVLGYAANDTKDGVTFTGNYYVQPTYRDETITILEHMLTEIFERFIKHRGRAPSRVIVYRHGCSEGNYRKVLLYEVPVMEYIIRKFAKNAPLTVIVPTKHHNTRLFKTNINEADSAPGQNIPPGTVVDTKIVHNQFTEFYLNSHVALQGSTKVVKYTVLSNSEKNPNLDLIQRWTHALCYSHQIITSSTSLPVPVMVAENYAKRGRELCNNRELLKCTPQQAYFIPPEETDAEDPREKEFVKKSREINVSHRWILRNKRYNA